MSLASERRATVRLFIVDENLNVLHGFQPCGTLPAALQRTASRLLPTFEGPAKKSQAVAMSEGRLVRMIPVVGKARVFAVAVERFISKTMLRAAIAQFRLSGREVEVLLLALEGYTAAETAKHLQLGISTINDHLNRLLLKTGARNKTALIAKVLGWGTNP
jgi:DNA-binding CsgD family transcriptional regulator